MVKAPVSFLLVALSLRMKILCLLVFLFLIFKTIFCASEAIHLFAPVSSSADVEASTPPAPTLQAFEATGEDVMDEHILDKNDQNYTSSKDYFFSFPSSVEYFRALQHSEVNAATQWPKSSSAFLSNVLSVYVVPWLIFTVASVIFDGIYGLVTGGTFSPYLVERPLRFLLALGTSLALQGINVIFSAVLKKMEIPFTLYKNGSCLSRKIFRGFDVEFIFIYIVGFSEGLPDSTGAAATIWTLLPENLIGTYFYYVTIHVVLQFLPRPIRVVLYSIYSLLSIAFFFPHSSARTFLKAKFVTPVFGYLRTSILPYTGHYISTVAQGSCGVVTNLFLTSSAESDPEGHFIYRTFRSVFPIFLAFMSFRKRKGMRSIFEWRYVSKRRLPWIVIGEAPDMAKLTLNSILSSDSFDEEDTSIEKSTDKNSNESIVKVSNALVNDRRLCDSANGMFTPAICLVVCLLLF